MTIELIEEILIDEWRNLYGESWTGVICPEAFAHPAKYSRALIREIYNHVIAEGWVEKGSTVVDPFGGVALGGLDAMTNGLHWIGCELEAKFYGLGNQNIALWNERWSGMPNWGSAVLLQGDSRKLASVISEARIAVSSPPYTGGALGNDAGCVRLDATEDERREREGAFRRDGYGQKPGQLGAMKEGDLSLVVSSPPYAGSINQNDQANDHTARAERKAAAGVDMTRSHNRGGPNSVLNRDQKYGNEPGQLGAMPEGSVDGAMAMAVSSPPFPQPYTGGGGINIKGYGKDGADKVGDRTYQSQGGDRAEGNLETLANEGFEVAITSPPYNPPMSQDHNGSRGGKRGTEPSETGAFVKYGNSEGQIEGLSMEGFDAAISSPPYEGLRMDGGKIAKEEQGGMRPYSDDPVDAWFTTRDQANIANNHSDTFWSASRTILEQLYSILTPGAHAVFVTKRFVRDKKIVEFTDQWIMLCEAVGFQLIHRHKAMLVEHSGTQSDMFGEDKEIKVSRKSFFRRLHERKSPETAIDWEDVTCFVKG